MQPQPPPQQATRSSDRQRERRKRKASAAVDLYDDVDHSDETKQQPFRALSFAPPAVANAAAAAVAAVSDADSITTIRPRPAKRQQLEWHLQLFGRGDPVEHWVPATWLHDVGCRLTFEEVVKPSYALMAWSPWANTMVMVAYCTIKAVPMTEVDKPPCRDVFVTDFYVAKPVRRHGIGRRLWQLVEELHRVPLTMAQTPGRFLVDSLMTNRSRAFCAAMGFQTMDLSNQGVMTKPRGIRTPMEERWPRHDGLTVSVRMPDLNRIEVLTNSHLTLSWQCGACSKTVFLANAFMHARHEICACPYCGHKRVFPISIPAGDLPNLADPFK